MRAGLIAAALVGALYACSGESTEDGPSSGGSTGVAAGSSSAGVAGDPGGGGDAGATGGGAALGGSSAGGAAGEGAGAGVGGLGGGELGGAGGEPPACEPIEVVECGSSWPDRCGTVNDGCVDVECGDTCGRSSYCRTDLQECAEYAPTENCQDTEDGSHPWCIEYAGDDSGLVTKWCSTLPPVGDSCSGNEATGCLRCLEGCEPHPVGTAEDAVCSGLPKCIDFGVQCGPVDDGCGGTVELDCYPDSYCSLSAGQCRSYWWPGPTSPTPTGDTTVCIDGPKYKDDNSGEIEYARFYTADPPNEEAGCTWDTAEACWKCGGAP